MSRTSIAAALLAATLTLTAAPASAGHDPSPPYVSSSQPGGYPLFAFHHDRLSATVHCWTGVQRRPNLDYRLWLKCDGDHRQGVLELTDLYFFDHGYATYVRYPDRTYVSQASRGPIYLVGAWHPVAEEVSVQSSVKFSYLGGASTSWARVCSWRVPRGQRSPIAAPAC